MERFELYDRQGGEFFNAEQADLNTVLEAANERIREQALSGQVYLYLVTVRYLDGETRQFRGTLHILQ